MDFSSIIHKHFDNRPITILDVGAGDGASSKELVSKGHKVYALELSIDRVRKLREISGLHVISGDFLKYTFGKTRFDAILLSAVLHLFPVYMWEDVVKRAHDLLGPDGLAYISVPLSSQISKESFITLLEKRGFSIVDYSIERASGSTIWLNVITKKSI